ncbi:MAG TPA: DNA polymerase ligase N-terminal domain-containing protein [Gemmataceae bacterium]|jgi:hypothetical protein|nr:DNA polymerase ligase N-terminal domain-containing protein [Gemmataceae bacterium]
MPRFVILEHDHPHLHWDFMLEAGEVLRTWKLFATPGFDKEIPAEKSFDHRPRYLNYEGPIGDNRGNVIRWDFGLFTWMGDLPEKLRVTLEGQKIQGIAQITQTREGNWVFCFTRNADGN